MYLRHMNNNNKALTGNIRNALVLANTASNTGLGYKSMSFFTFTSFFYERCHFLVSFIHHFVA